MSEERLTRADIRTGLGLLILNEGITDRATLRERAKEEGYYTSEGSFSRDLAQLRKENGDQKEFFFENRGNYGGGRRSIVVNGEKYKLKKVDSPDNSGWFVRRDKGSGKEEIVYGPGPSGGGGGRGGWGNKSPDDDDEPDYDYYSIDDYFAEDMFDDLFSGDNDSNDREDSGDDEY